MNTSGILYTSSSQTTIHLTLDKVEVNVLIVDVSARVTLVQTYTNALDTVTGRCKYVFPVPASAAVCAFNMETSDGRIVEGVVKDRDTAQEDHESALRAGQLTGLVNYATDDIFTISIGSIPAHTSIVVSIEYVMNLINDDNADEVRFQLPNGIGQRYGAPPEEITSAHRPTSRTRIKITCEVQTSGRIKSITSPTHPDDITETKYVTKGGRLSRRRSTIKYRSRSFLDRDFVLIVNANGLDSPRCFAELQEDEHGKRTLALQLTLVPKLRLPPIKAQEYLFVLDRSGSMSSDSPRSRIATAKDTLSLLLRMLPASGTLFNVYIFDNVVERLSPNSLQYNEKNLKDASIFVDHIEARGGTELGKAMRHVLQARTQTIPTVVFLLTDGEVYGDETVQHVRDAVKQAAESAALRVFTLGIGNQVSTATCESIAAAGNGVYLYATGAESIVSKCARLFRAGRTSIMKNATIDWGLLNEHLGGIMFSNQTLSPRTIATLPPPTIQQAPTQVHSIHSGTQTIVSAIIQLKKVRIPEKVTIRGTLDNGTNDAFELSVPVDTVFLNGASHGLPLVHTLAAWRVIQEHEGGRAELPSSIMPATSEELRRAVIIRLGKRYQLVSRYTSFIAVDLGQGNRRRSRTPFTFRDSTSGQATSHTAEHSTLGLLQTTFNLLSRLLGGRNPVIEDNRTLPGSWPLSPPSSGDETDGDSDGGDSDGSAESHDTFSTMSSLNSCDCSDESWPELRPQLSPEEEEMQHQPSPRIELLNLDSNQAPAQARQAAQLPPVPVEVVQLVRLQSFDGSYSLDTIRPIFKDAVDGATANNVEGKVWATALAVAFMQKRMGNQRELLNDLMMKAMEFLKGLAEVGQLDVLLQRAADALG